jgi:hypothetical protein
MAQQNPHIQKREVVNLFKPDNLEELAK